MAREKGELGISAAFEPQSAKPLDCRMIVPTYAELILAATWTANDSSIYAYKGMLVNVHSDSNASLNGVYKLNSLPYSTAANWELVGGGEAANIKNAGTVTAAIITDNTNGLIDISSIDCYFNTAADFSGTFVKKTLAALNGVQLVANQYTYIIANYNSGTAIYQTTTDNTIINHSTILNVAQVYWENVGVINELHIFYSGQYGLGLANKIGHRLIHTERFGYQDGLILSEYGTRNINVTSGSLWYDGEEIITLSVATATTGQETHFYYPVGGVWTAARVSQYPNTQYSNGTDLVTLTNNKYVPIFVFKCVNSTDNCSFIVLGTEYNSIAECLSAPIPLLPDVIVKQGKLVGRLVIQKSAATASRITNELPSVNSQSLVVNHNDTANRDAADSHPISAITGLQTNLNNLVTTASNGITKDGTDFKLGGDLVENTDIIIGANELRIIQNLFNSGLGFNSTPLSIKLQSDGKILVGGDFTDYNNTLAPYFIRLNTNGSIDTSFVYGTGFNGDIYSIAVQSDGKIIVGGNFTSYNGTPANRIIRLNTNGSVDTSFGYGTGFDVEVYSIAVQSDGKTLIGGQFTSYNGTPANRIIRLNTDGSVDSSFVYGSGFNGDISSIAIQSDGKIVIGGNFTSYNGTPANYIIRLNTNGSVDTSFGYGTGFDFPILSISIQSDSKIIAVGGFTDYNSTAANYIIRLNTDGSVDSSFVYGSGFNGVTSYVFIQSDGMIFVGGDFTSYNGTTVNYIVRLTPNGSIDTSFLYGTGFDSNVRCIAQETSGKILLGGNFTSYNGTAANRIISLTSTGNISSGEGVIIKPNGVMESISDMSTLYTSRSFIDKAYLLSIIATLQAELDEIRTIAYAGL